MINEKQKTVETHTRTKKTNKKNQQNNKKELPGIFQFPPVFFCVRRWFSTSQWGGRQRGPTRPCPVEDDRCASLGRLPAEEDGFTGLNPVLLVLDGLFLFF